MTAQLEALPQFLRPRLRLFLSVDLVGSTSLKQNGLPSNKTSESSSDGTIPGANWFSPFLEFYQSIGALFAAHFQDILDSAYNQTFKFSHVPEIWKSNGDELIYFAEITNEFQVHVSWIAGSKQLMDIELYLRAAEAGEVM